MTRKILVFIILGMFLISITASVAISKENKESDIFKIRKYNEKRPIFPVYTEKGIEWATNNDNLPEPKDKPESPPGKKPKPTPPPEPGTGDGVVRKWALCIGIADYEGTDSDLEYPDDDAMDWKSFLQGEGYNVVVITDNQATAGNINAKIDDLLANEDADDIVAFTYSGHGAKYRKYGSCIVSYDLYAMTHGWFKSKFDTAESQQIYFAFDACVIGDFDDSVTNGRLGAFASNSKNSYDGDETMENGIFTYYQMEGWDTYASFEDNSAYAVQEMKDWAAQYVFISVDPFYLDNFDGIMIP